MSNHLWSRRFPAFWYPRWISERHAGNLLGFKFVEFIFQVITIISGRSKLCLVSQPPSSRESFWTRFPWQVNCKKTPFSSPPRSSKNSSFTDNFMVGGQNLGSAATLGSGVPLHVMYQLTKAHGNTIVGGTASTVVPSGGYVQGGVIIPNFWSPRR